MKKFSNTLIFSALSCLLLSACSNGAGQEAVTEITLLEKNLYYSHRGADLRYEVDDVLVTFASTDSNKTFYVNGRKLVLSADTCISVTSIDFTNAKFYNFTDDGGRVYAASPLPFEVNRITSLGAKSLTPYQYYIYDKNTIISGEQLRLNPAAALYGDFIASAGFDRASDEPNLPSGICFVIAGNELIIELSLSANLTDGATISLFFEDE